jgi:hypothetical protein
MADEKPGLLWRSVFWSFKRGSWQYDLIVIAILAFIFLTPQEFFGDEPRPPVVRQVQDLGDQYGTVVFWVEPNAVPAEPVEARDAKLQQLLFERSSLNLEIASVETSLDPEGALHAYIVYARP